jgi:hypothetical protein
MPTLTFKVSPEEARTLRAKARAEKSSLSAFLRGRVLEARSSARRKIVVRRHPESGLPFDPGRGKPAKVSRDEIRALLADFP